MANDTVDTRVVRMEFDNKQFEKNVKQTSKSLDNLKDSLDFKGVGDGLDKVRVKISALEVAATTFVVRLTNKLITLGTVMVKSLSVDNIAAGWDKFGEKTISVATMMAQRIRVAGEEITELGRKTEVVNQLLEKLTWFADETSYSLSDMTNYASKFIAAGIDLDKAVNAMEGIATWAALAGQGSQKASIAMMQLSQAMGRSINKQDWMSIQNAGMDMEEFREQVLETAVALGQLTKEGNKFITKTGKKFEKSTFTQYFSEGWFTSDVLIETLNKYSAAVDQIYALAKEKGLTASEVMEQYGDQLDEFGVKAFKASQEARTFRDVLNSVKDAVTTKWMVTFENIFGGKDEAIELWSKLADRLYDVFAESGNFRNNVLSIWKEAKGRDDIFGEDGAFWNLYDAIDNIRLLIKKAWDTLFPISEMESEDARAKDIARTLKKITANIKEFTKNLAMSEETAKKISRVFEIFFGILKVGLYTLLAIRYALDPIIQTLKQLTNTILTKIAAMTGGINNILLKIEKVANRVRDTLWNLIDIINPKGTLDKVFSFIKALYNVISDFKPLERLVALTDELFKSFREGGGTQENLIKIFKGLLSIISMLAKAFLTLAQALNKYILPILDKILTATAQIVGFITGVVVSVIAAISEVITAINDALEGNANMSDIGDSFKNLIINIGTSIAKILPILQSLLSIVSSLIDVILLIPKLLDSISIRLTGRGIIDNLKKFFDGIANAIKGFAENIQNGSIESGSSSILSGTFNALESLFKGLIEFLKGLLAVGNLLIQSLGMVFKVIGTALQKIAQFFTNLFNGNFKELTKAQKTAIALIAVLGALIAIATLLNYMFYRFMDAIDPIGVISESLIDTIDRIRLSMLAKAIEQFSNAILKFAIAMAILDNLKSDISKSLSVFVIVGALIGILIYVLGDFDYTVDKFGETIKKTSISLKKVIADSAKSMVVYRGIAKVLHAIGLVLMEIAVAALILDKLDSKKNTFGEIIILLGAILLSVYFMMKTLNDQGSELELLSRKKKDSNKVYNSISKDLKTALTGIVALMLSLIIAMKIMDTVNPESFKNAMIMFVAISAAIVILITVIGMVSVRIMKSMQKASDRAKVLNAKKEKLSSIFKGVSLALITMAALIIALSVAMAITTKSLTKMAESTGSSGGANSSSFNANLLVPVLSLVALLAAITASIAVLVKLTKGTSKAQINKISQLMIFFSGTLTAIALALSSVAQLPIGNILAATGSLVVILAMLSGLAFIMTKISISDSMINLSTSLLLLGTGLLVFAQAMKSLAEANMKKAAEGLKLIGISLVALVAIAYISQSLIPTMIALSAVIVTISSVVLFLGTGLALIANIVDKLSTSGEKFKAFLTNFAEGIMSMIKVILINLATLIPKVLVLLINGLGDVIGALINFLKTYVGPLAEALLNVVTTVLELVAQHISTIINILNRILGSIILGMLDFIKTFIGPIVDRLIDIIINLMEALTLNLPKIANSLTNMTISLVKMIADILPQVIQTLLPALLEALVGLWNSIMEMFGAESGFVTVEQFKEIFGQIFNIIGEVLGELMKMILDFLQSIDWQSILDAIMTVLGVIGRILKALLPVINAIIDAVLQLVNAIDWGQFLGFISKVLNLIAEIIEWLAPILAKVISVVLKVIINLLTRLFEIIQPILEFIMTILEPIIDFILYIVEILGKLANGESVDWNKFFELGWNIVKGIAKGIAQAIPKLLKGVFEGIGNFFKSIFGIHSPSKVFAKYGEYMIQGLGNGLEDEEKKEKKRFTQIATDTLHTFEDALFNNDNEYDYVMSIGMDISNVEKESAKVQDLMNSISSKSVEADTAYGRNASKLSSSIAASERANSKVDKAAETNTDNSINTTNNNVFNITSTDPAGAADEIDKILKKNAIKAKFAKGSI